MKTEHKKGKHMINMDEKQETDYLSPMQIAIKLNVTERKVLAYLNSGKLVGVKLGRQWRVSQAEFQAFLKRNQKR